MLSRKLFFFAALILASLVACKQESRTVFIPLTGSGVSSRAVVVNAATRAYHDIYSYNVAFNSAGYGLAVWESRSGMGYRIIYSLFNPLNATWSEPKELYVNAQSPVVASNGTGFMVGFMASNLAYAVPWSGGSFGTPVKIPTLSGSCGNMRIASNGTGYCALWTQYRSNGSSAYAAIHNGTSWGVPQDIMVSAASNYCYDTRIVSNGSGYCALWEYSPANRLYASVYNGSWSAAAIADNGTYPYDYDIAGSSDRYILVFSESNNIYANIYDGAWGGPADIDNGAAGAYNPSIASNGTTLCVAWNQSSNAYARLYNGSWQPITDIDAGANPVDYVRVASNGGGYCAVMEQSDGSVQKIYASIYSASSWTGAGLISQTGSEVCETPGVKGQAGGGYLAHWLDTTDPLAYRLGASVYNGSWSAPGVVDGDP